ncbi:MAG TPA: hypothetical protein VGI93_00170 [Steroidobacteraceae bacterium]|jgi:hypothetical protein
MRAVGWLVGAGLLLGGISQASDLPETGVPLSALWRTQHVTFLYAGRTSRYSCDSLADKLRGLLLELGARFDLKVHGLTCDPTHTQVELSFSSPALPPDSSKAAHQGYSKPVDARFERFTLTTDEFRNFVSADCELIEEFVRQVLPKLATRDVRSDIDCTAYRHRSNGSGYLVRGEILRPLPAGAQ